MTTAAISIGLPPLSFTFSRCPFSVLARSEILLRFGWWAADGLERPADVAPHTDGTPEHVVDLRRATLLHDERRHLLILQVPGTTHFVLKPTHDATGSASDVERRLIAALERCGHTQAQPIVCRAGFSVNWPAVLAVGAIAFLVLAFLLRIFR